MRLAAVPLLLTTLASSVGDVRQQPSSSGDGRVALLRGLERLMVTGEPRDVAHDDGELLQEAVSEAIRRGDTEVERLAIRAAAPIVVHMTRVIASVQSLSGLQIESRSVLKLPRSVAYQAEIDASLDGAAFVQIATVKSGAGAGAGLDRVLPREAVSPGFHRIALRARLSFTPTDGRLEPWTEERDLPGVSYALYDPESSTASDARSFLFGQLRTSARQFDAQLPDIPLESWLRKTLQPRVEKRDPYIYWMTQFCDERTSEAGTAPRTGPLCAVGYFGPKGVIAELWFRTGRIDATSDGFAWVVEEPAFQAISMQGSGADVGALSALPALLETDSESRPRGDVSIAPDDIVITSAEGAPAAATITVRNTSDVPLHRVYVDVAAALGKDDQGGRSRHFVVDIPAHGATGIHVPVAFPAGYGTVVVVAMQLTEHGTFQDWAAFDPTPEDAVAFRIFNAKGAPAGYVNTIREACGCRGW